MQSVLSKLFTGSKIEAYEDILRTYHRKKHAVINYLYFANIPAKGVFENHKVDINKEEYKEALLDDYKILSKATISASYKQALLESDFLFTDGIALQLFYWIAYKLKKIKTPRPRLENLNGTDFCLGFLDWLQEDKGSENIHIILYGTYPGILEKTKTFLLNKGYDVSYIQDGYTNFDWEQVEQTIQEKNKKYPVLIVARSTPEYPIQELWAWSNQEKIRKNNLLVFTQAGTFDFWAGIQKRAPKLRRTRKIERLRRLITHPKRNRKKVLDSLKIIKYVFSYLLLKK